MKKKIKVYKWICDECHQHFKLKKELIEHLQDEADEYSQMADVCDFQLEELGVNPYNINSYEKKILCCLH